MRKGDHRKAPARKWLVSLRQVQPIDSPKSGFWAEDYAALDSVELASQPLVKAEKRVWPREERFWFSVALRWGAVSGRPPALTPPPIGLQNKPKVPAFVEAREVHCGLGGEQLTRRFPPNQVLNLCWRDLCRQTGCLF